MGRSVIEAVPVTTAFRVLVVDDEAPVRELLLEQIGGMGYEAASACDGEAALELFRQDRFDIALVDLKMPQMDGIELLQELRRIDESISVIVMTGYGSIQDAVEAMKSGAEDFLLKPLSMEAVALLLERIRERRQLRQSYTLLRERLGAIDGEQRIVTRSRKMQRILGLTAKVAQLPSTVLIQGESGTGKELIARSIHDLGPRSEKPFVAFNCAVLPVHLLESELFGYERGAFTGASSRKIGYFEAANGGTIFLDEISEMSIDLQAKLLRVIQEKRFRRLGGTHEITTDARIIASTNRDMKREVAEERFRKDLYYRLNVVKIAVPPRRERREDILHLAYYFLDKYKSAFGKRLDRIDAGAAECLQAAEWEGNVRELENAVEQAVALAEGTSITVRDLPAELQSRQTNRTATRKLKPYQEAKREFETGYLKAALQSTRGNLAQTARSTGIPRQYLYEKMEKLGIDRSAFR